MVDITEMADINAIKKTQQTQNKKTRCLLKYEELVFTLYLDVSTVGKKSV